jgi:hypothetical protein
MINGGYDSIPVSDGIVAPPYVYYVLDISKETFFTFCYRFNSITSIATIETCSRRCGFANKEVIIVNILWYSLGSSRDATDLAIIIINGAFIASSSVYIRKEF